MIIPQLYNYYKESYKVSTDTRSIEPGSIYFSLKGEHFNGNRFAKEALDRGAAYAVVDEEITGISDKIIRVENVLTTLQALAHHHRRQLGIPIIALAGSNGKTTTKELVFNVLSKKFNVSATKGNLNNHLGVPLTLLDINPWNEIAVVEMGANHLHEIAELCEIAEPDFGYITNFGKAHLEGFGSIEGVIKAKSELYEYLRDKGKKVFVNADDSLQMQQSKGLERYLFSALETSDKQFKFVQRDDHYAAVEYQGTLIKSNLIGQYNHTNIAAAICIGLYFGLSITAIQEAIADYMPQNNRSQIIKKDGAEIIMDAYNANPSSVLAALNSFASHTEAKTVILGDMFELGDDSLEEHENIAKRAVSLGFEQIILAGKYFSKIKETKAIKFENKEELIGYLNNIPLHRKILIKGSRAMRLEDILPYIQHL